MGNVSWRGQSSSEDTDSSLQGDLDEDTGTDAPSPAAHTGSFECNTLVFLDVLANGGNFVEFLG